MPTPHTHPSPPSLPPQPLSPNHLLSALVASYVIALLPPQRPPLASAGIRRYRSQAPADWEQTHTQTHTHTRPPKQMLRVHTYTDTQTHTQSIPSSLSDLLRIGKRNGTERKGRHRGGRCTRACALYLPLRSHNARMICLGMERTSQGKEGKKVDRSHSSMSFMMLRIGKRTDPPPLLCRKNKPTIFIRCRRVSRISTHIPHPPPPHLDSHLTHSRASPSHQFLARAR